MSFSAKRERDALGEMLEEARWVYTIDDVGKSSRRRRRGREIDAMLEALAEAHELRRRLAAQLARESER